MDDTTLQQWQALHRRYVCGETLTPEERAVYQAGCEELDAGERLNGVRETIQRLKAQLAVLEQERVALLEDRTRQEAQIEALEAYLNAPKQTPVAAGN